jgi:hypothetical protein
VTPAQVIAAADTLAASALAAETRAAYAPTAAERNRALDEAKRLCERAAHMRGLAPVARLREIGAMGRAA